MTPRQLQNAPGPRPSPRTAFLALVLLLEACSGGTSDGTSSGGGGDLATGAAASTGGAGGVATGGSGASSSGSMSHSGGTMSGGAGSGAVTGTGAQASSGGEGGGSGGGEGGGSGGTNDAISYTFPYEGPDEDGSKLWLRYPAIPASATLATYQATFKTVVGLEDTPSVGAAVKELLTGLSGLTGAEIIAANAAQAGSIVVGTTSSAPIAGLGLTSDLTNLGPEGYVVETADQGAGPVTAVLGQTDVGALYGAFALLRHLQSHKSIAGLKLTASPKIQHRVLNHWDNLDGTVERGYAGKSLWNWSGLPGQLSPRYEAYARANASIGINGTVLTNVNADAQVLTASYLSKVKALADVFRPYGIRVYLTARFSAPIELNATNTADPLDNGVRQWWANKADEIYGLIPDFGGFLVKANSEGQPGPQDYGRTHADGANMMAEALSPHGGIVMWRAFVYSSSGSTDRIREAYDEFHPLDGQFAENVLLQPKNGPLDFQPREPFHPLFGAMPQTPLALEVQVTKEYLGEDTHLAYLGPLYEEVLKSDTLVSGAGSTVARVVDGSLHDYSATAMAGVSNIGSDANWTGSHFNQANWYVFGRMAWDPDISAEAVAEEWVRQTLSNDPALVAPVVELMMASREALVDYMTPLGLAHIMGNDHHYGPAPWSNSLSRPEWNPVYYHKADMQGIGFDRTATGSNAISQYSTAVQQTLADRAIVPEEFLLFFHRVGWSEPLSSGRTLWEEMVHRYSSGVDQVMWMRDSWASVEGRLDGKRFADVASFLQIQHYEARWWRDACLSYFSQVGGQQIPAGYSLPENGLSYYQGLTCPADVTKPRCSQINTGMPSPAITP